MKITYYYLSKYFTLCFCTLAFCTISAQNTVSFKVATLNCEWLSCPDNAPNNDALQINNIATVLSYVDADIFCLQEIGTSNSYKTLDTLVKKMGSSIWACNISTNNNSNCGQNQGIIYKKSKMNFVSSSQMSAAGTSYNFAGRYPALYEMNFIVGDQLVPVYFVNLHMKAMSDETSYDRRLAASTTLKTLLDGSQWNTKNVVIIGDLNDYLVGTQCNSCGEISPYKNFMDDSQNWKGTTSNLISLYYYPKPVIDNIIISNELFDKYVSNSAFQDIESTTIVNNYSSSTTDHVAISINLSFSINGNGDSTACQSVNYTNTLTHGLDGFVTQNLQGEQVWSSDAVYGAKISGYTLNGNMPNLDVLLSPVLDLSGMESASFFFEHAIKYGETNTEKLHNYHLVGVTRFDATYTQFLEVPTMPVGDSWTFFNSGQIEIPAEYLTSDVQLVFVYQSDASYASTWEIRNLKLTSVCSPTLPTSIEEIVADTKIQVYPNPVEAELNVQCAMCNVQCVEIFDITGKLHSTLHFDDSTIKIRVGDLKPGTYLLKIGDYSTKFIKQ
ncbi:MAG: T9SS type A sorting domain-containing protein [Bacteroidales bacterium]|nr:T9SS type A sorting domain-containing protein [Bacteroidales bacterium]